MTKSGRLIAVIAVFSVAGSCARGPDAPDGADPGLDAAIAEIEAGRATTPLVAQPAPGSKATVTFLVKSIDGQAPRIVSDVTGWGESPDNSTFDLTIGTMTRLFMCQAPFEAPFAVTGLGSGVSISVCGSGSGRVSISVCGSGRVSISVSVPGRVGGRDHPRPWSWSRSRPR